MTGPPIVASARNTGEALRAAMETAPPPDREGESRFDTLTPAERSERMSRVRGRDTKPEMRVRRLVHEMGFRYRLHRRDLPGTPDMTFPGKRKVIFVHGCFWHRHKGCKLARMPKSRLDFWGPKLEGNRRRDLENQRKLRERGWEPMVIWECELRDKAALAERIGKFLADGDAQ